MRAPLLLLSALLTTVVVSAPAFAAPCPNLTIKVDNDIAGSGYSEEKPENWQTNNVGACNGTYRYLSKYVGDLSSKGKAIWKPKITVNGWYQVTAGFRATVNRTNDADYFVHDDLGGKTHLVIDQAHVGDCTYEDLGTIYCAVGGQCRVVLDGTDDNKSDCADITTFKLVSCDEPGDAGADSGGPARCDGIRDNAAYEVCVETDTTCAGVFTRADPVKFSSNSTPPGTRMIKHLNLVAPHMALPIPTIPTYRFYGMVGASRRALRMLR